MRIKDLANVSLNNAVLSSQIPIDSAKRGTKGIYLSSITTLSDGKYFPLSGGNVKLNNDIGVLKLSGANGFFSILGGNLSSTGARLDVTGLSTNYKGSFGLHPAGIEKGLIGNKDGQLTWFDKNIVRSINEETALSDGRLNFYTGHTHYNFGGYIILNPNDICCLYRNGTSHTQIVNAAIFNRKTDGNVGFSIINVNGNENIVGTTGRSESFTFIMPNGNEIIISNSNTYAQYVNYYINSNYVFNN